MKMFKQINRSILLTLILALFAIGFTFNAQVVSAQTSIPLPSCTQPNIGGFVPYIYEGELHSFDYLVFDNDRGVVAPTQTIIAGKGIETRYSTEWTLNGDTRVHVDVPSWEGFSGTFPVTVHVKTGAGASCETQATFNVSLPANVPPAPISQNFGTGGPVSTASSDTSPAPTSAVTSINDGKDDSPSVTISVDEEVNNTNIMEDVTNEDEIFVIEDDSSGSETLGFKERFSALTSLFAPITPESGVCRTLPVASWVVLSVIHVLIAGVIIFYLRNLISESNLWFTVALLVPFIGFLALWFVFDGCRMHQWFPVVIALVSLGTVLGVPADDGPKKIVASTSGGPVMKIPNTPSKNIESPTPKAKKKEEVIKF
jgi:hypothetical protein